MTEALLVIFLLEVFYNVIFSIIKSWKEEKGHFFADLHEKYQEKYIMACVTTIFLIFILSLIFQKSIITNIILLLIVSGFGFALYLDFHKKLKEKLKKFF